MLSLDILLKSDVRSFVFWSDPYKEKYIPQYIKDG